LQVVGIVPDAPSTHAKINRFHFGGKARFPPVAREARHERLLAIEAAVEHGTSAR
jgi:hypothetical protein